MDEIKIIFYNDNDLSKLFNEKYNFKEIIKTDFFTINSWSRDLDWEKLFFVNYIDFSKWFDYVMQNYQVSKIIFAWTAEINNSTEIKSWDIVVPNTFIDDKWNPLFLEYAIWDNFDLDKFWLILSWVCYSWVLSQEEDSEFLSDIVDNDSYNNLTLIKNNNLLDKTVVIKMIEWNDIDKSNLLNIVDFVL